MSGPHPITISVLLVALLRANTLLASPLPLPLLNNNNNNTTTTTNNVDEKSTEPKPSTNSATTLSDNTTPPKTWSKQDITLALSIWSVVFTICIVAYVVGRNEWWGKMKKFCARMRNGRGKGYSGIEKGGSENEGESAEVEVRAGVDIDQRRREGDFRDRSSLNLGENHCLDWGVQGEGKDVNDRSGSESVLSSHRAEYMVVDDGPAESGSQ